MKMSRRSFVKMLFLAFSGLMAPGLAAAQEVREFEVVMDRYKYSPSIFRVEQGDLVRFHLRTRDVMHGFYISGYDLNVEVDRKHPRTLEFIADRTGVFPIKCSVICGPMHTIMQAKLVVEPNFLFWVALALGSGAALGLSRVKDQDMEE